MNIPKPFRQYIWFFAGLLALAWVIIVNLFPSGRIILGGDVLQPMNLGDQFSQFHYGWFSGRVTLFYGIFYLLDLVGVSYAGQLSWYLGLFLISAYASFFLFCRLIFPTTQASLATLFSLFYATNVFTLYVFTSTWGFTSYLLLYVFIPGLTGLYLKVLATQERKYIFSFLLLAFAASMSFSNPVFALALGIYFFLLTIALFAFRFIDFDRSRLKTIGLLLAGALFLNAYWILPVVPIIGAGVEEIARSNDVVLTERLHKTSNAIYDTIRLLPTSEQDRYYPANFPYPSLSWLEPYIMFLAFVPFFIILLGWIQKKDDREQKLYAIFFALLVFFIVLVARVRFPFDSINSVLFQLPGMNALRGWEKLAIFTPFILSALLLGYFSAARGKRFSPLILSAFCAVMLFLALPFYAGGIQTELSYILSNSKKKDYKSASYSALIKIPEPYHAVGETFKDNASRSKISMLPFSDGSSVGRVNLPELKINGPHPANFLYAKKYVEPNDVYLPGWAFGGDIEKGEYAPEWITRLYGLMGIEYIFYHHDAKPKAVSQFEPARKYLEERGTIEPVTTNEWFTLYRLNKEYLFPYVYTHSEALILRLSPEGLAEGVQNFHAQAMEAPFTLYNPKSMSVSAEKITPQSWLFLNERYDTLWRAEYISSSGEKVPLIRNTEVKYANAWKVGDIDSKGKIEIYYLPVRLLQMGIVITGVALLLLIMSALYFLLRKRR